MLTLLAATMIFQINQYRDTLGLLPVQVSTTTCNIAESRLNEVQIDFSHKSFYTSELAPGYNFENLAVIPIKDDPISGISWTLEAWKNSPLHNLNLLEEMDSMCVRTDGRYWVFIGNRKSR